MSKKHSKRNPFHRKRCADYQDSLTTELRALQYRLTFHWPYHLMLHRGRCNNWLFTSLNRRDAPIKNIFEYTQLNSWTNILIHPALLFFFKFQTNTHTTITMQNTEESPQKLYRHTPRYNTSPFQMECECPF